MAAGSFVVNVCFISPKGHFSITWLRVKQPTPSIQSSPAPRANALVQFHLRIATARVAKIGLRISDCVVASLMNRIATILLRGALSIQLSIDPDIIRHREGELRQITLSVNDLQISCRTSYSPSVA